MITMLEEARKLPGRGMHGRDLRLMLLVCVCAACISGCQKKGAFLYVDGEAVPAAEMELLEQDADQAVRMKVLQQWAEESGVAGESFSFDDMLRQMEEENLRRAQLKETGGIIYGVTEYTALQYYHIRMGEYERALKDIIMAEASMEELEAWYQAHLEDYWQIGEVKAIVTVRADGAVVAEEEVVLNPSNYRTLSEQNEELAAVMEGLPEGGESGWTDIYGNEWNVRCTSREEGSCLPFEEVAGAVSEQYARERFEQELAQRAGSSRVEDLRQ